jgi:two-component system, chemotaxis family, sensor kinase CheA
MGDTEIIREFLVESYENLDRLDQDLIALEKDPANRDTLASVFRTIHTIKGTSGFLAFNQLEAVTHAGENLLARLRDGQLTLTPEITTALLSMVDAVRQTLGSIENHGSEGIRNDQQLIARLLALLDAEAPAAVGANHAEQKNSDLAPVAAAEKQVPALGDILVEAGKAKPSDVHQALQQQSEGDPRHLGEILVEKGSIKTQDVVDALNTQQQARGQSASESTLRIDVGQLDGLMNRVGELVLLRNQIVQYTNSTEDSELLSNSQRLNLLTTELQEGVMKMRMQPIGNIWSKFPRTVRDVAVACGKQVRIEMQGQETELDRTIIEAIKAPLTHLVRNAVDHGIESPQVRQAAGKNPEGLLLLRAFHEGGQVNIEITDDGAGLDYEKIRNKARTTGLITADQASRMTEREIANLIFRRGLSTAEKVSNVSGRGVGMDVVQTNIEKIGGTVDVQSRTGQATTVRMKIPLTLAIIPALMVTSAGDRYAIPQVSLLELVRLEGDQTGKNIGLVNRAPVCRLRGRLLPLVYLNKELGVDVSTASSADSPAPHFPAFSSIDCSTSNTQSVNIIVLRADDRQFGLVVDEINDTEEIVVKALSKQLKSINTYAGATIMGDGKVALILDVLGLAQRANVVSDVRESVVEKDSAGAAMTAEQSKSNTVLLFQYGQKGRIAIDLPLVARLEEFPPESVEMAADQEVVQYRGQIMPLLRVSEVLESKRGTAPQKDQETLHVVVYSDRGRCVGLVVDRILDIVEESFVIQRQSGRRGIVGSAVIQKRVTDILDVPGLIAAANRGHATAVP